MLDEIVEYGPSCQEITLEKLFAMEKGEPLTDEEQKEMEEGELDIEKLLEHMNDKYNTNLKAEFHREKESDDLHHNTTLVSSSGLFILFFTILFICVTVMFIM